MFHVHMYSCCTHFMEGSTPVLLKRSVKLASIILKRDLSSCYWLTRNQLIFCHTYSKLSVSYYTLGVCRDITCIFILESDNSVGIEELVDDFVAFYAMGKTLIKHEDWLYQPLYIYYAGQESVSYLLCFALLELLLNPNIMER